MRQVAFILIALGLTVTAWLARNEAERWRVIGENEAETARQTTQFVVDQFKQSDPSSGLTTGTASASDVPVIQRRAVDPDVVQVETGGSWEVGERHGRYRVVIAYLGFEEVSSQIRFAWVEESGVRDIDKSIARTEVLHEALLGPAEVKTMVADD